MTTEHKPHSELPERVVVGANGAYWRQFEEHYSMCPVSTDNDPVKVVATYVRVPDEDYSPAYQDEYQRLWHRDAARVRGLEEQLQTAQAQLAEIEEQAPPTPQEWHGLNEQLEVRTRDYDDAVRTGNIELAKRKELQEQLEAMRIALEILRDGYDEHEATCASLFEPPSRAMECDCAYGIIEGALSASSHEAQTEAFEIERTAMAAAQNGLAEQLEAYRLFVRGVDLNDIGLMREGRAAIDASFPASEPDA